MKNIEKLPRNPMEKSKTLMDKDLTWTERAFLIDVFIAEEMTRHMELSMEKFRKMKYEKA